MMSTKNVQNTRISEQIRAIHASLIDIVSVMNRPDLDEVLIKEAGVRLDRALFPLLVGIERLGPVSIVDLAARAGRDHTTVSRQVAKLESLGLVDRQANETDRRVREAVVTKQGKEMTMLIDAARERIGTAVFSSWKQAEIDNLVRLMRKFADAMKDFPQS
ncbi:MarR family transcriptional regulator [Bradyrhizobium sp. 139]|uniref:MarR family winged helix-turn-helix transcriptional regulator n=1 Tax=Bradyrhizobium sp. 139 TaxID=2782616 RepID=UPI001FFABFA5|nr:MarR family transcriptional regulator [Bradyrhizobium sp. 139]